MFLITRVDMFESGILVQRTVFQIAIGEYMTIAHEFEKFDIYSPCEINIPNVPWRKTLIMENHFVKLKINHDEPHQPSK